MTFYGQNKFSSNANAFISLHVLLNTFKEILVDSAMTFKDASHFKLGERNIQDLAVFMNI